MLYFIRAYESACGMTRTTTLTAPSTAVTLDFPTKLPSSLVRNDWNKILLSGPFTNKIVYQEFDRPSTPDSDGSSPRNEPPEFISRPKDISDDEDYPQQRVTPKKGGYDSRIEQILYENQDLQIIITDAGKSHESGASYIAYTIRTGVW